MAGRIGANTSPARSLFTAEQWKKLEANPGGRIADADWAKFSPEQREAARALRAQRQADGAAAPSRTQDVSRLQGAPTTTHWAGRNTAVHDIQGTSNRSPLEGQTVGTEGIVTAVDDRGFYLQEPGQGTEKGSPGLYVFTGRPPSVKPGDDVQVAGKVLEFALPNQAQDFPDSTTTQLEADPGSITVKSSGNPLPELLIGKGGIALSHTGSNDSLWERMEGARVRVNNPVVVGAPNLIPRFSDLSVVPDGGDGAGPRTTAGGLIRDAAGNPQVVPVRMPVADLPALNVGARLPQGIVGNVVERHGQHQITVWDSGGPGNVVASPNTPQVTTLRQKFPDPKHVLFVASLNGENKDVKLEDRSKVEGQDVRNVDDDVGDQKLTRMCQQIVTNLASPDIVAMQEIQDNDGAEVSDVTDASLTWKAISDKIVELGGPRYEFVDRPPVNGAEGGQPGGNIRTGFLYNPQRVTLDQQSVHRMDDPAFAGTRVPLVATFEFKHGAQTERVTLASVHNKSKRGGANTDDARTIQEQAINAWAKKNAPADDFSHLGVFGDRNAYTDEQPLQIEQQGGALKLLSEQLPAEARYSTQFGGSSGELDHASAKSSVPIAIDLVHMNSDFDQRFRASDHDGTLTAWDFRRGQ